MARSTKKHRTMPTEEEVALTEAIPAEEETEVTKTVEILGTTYSAGNTFTFESQEVTVVGEESLAASSSSGVAAGTYPVVSMIIKPGNRTAYRAVVDGTLYPIREYGSPKAVISKIRGESKPRVKKSRAAAPTGDGEGLTLTVGAMRILGDYLEMKPGESGSLVVSGLITAHLGPEVEQMRSAREAIHKLPPDFLAAMAGTSEEERRKMLEVLKK